MSGRFLDSASPGARRAAAVVYSVATGMAVLYWTAGAGWPAFREGNVVGALFSEITAMMIWWLVAGVGLRIVGRFDISRRDPAPAEKPTR